MGPVQAAWVPCSVPQSQLVKLECVFLTAVLLAHGPWSEDSFNLYGLRTAVTNYKECLDLILDYAPESDPEPEEWSGPLAKQARDLYGLIHARFIITQRGQQLMVRPRTPLDACAFF